MHQHAHHGNNITTHSSPYIEHYKNVVDDCSIKVSDGKHITTLKTHKNPMHVRGELPYMPLCPYTLFAINKKHYWINLIGQGSSLLKNGEETP